MKKVAILAAPGFEEIELMAPLDILRRLNMDVVLAGVQSDKVVSTHEVTVSTDTMLDKLHADKLDALILPGGAGSWVLRDTPEVIHLVKKMHEAGKLVAAICAAPIAIPLILVVVAMVLGLVVLILALVAGVAVGGVVAIGAGVFTACAGFSVLFSAGLPTMMFFCGVGLLSSGVGLLLIAGSFLLAGLCFRGMAALLGRWLNRREVRA